MTSRELFAQYRAAAWPTTDDVEQFVASAGELTTDDILKLLDLTATRLGLPEQHRQRCFAFYRLAERVSDKSLFSSYVKALRAADPTLRALLIRLIPKVNSALDHPALVALLQSSDAQLRKEVAQILPTIGGRKVFELLGEMAGEPSFPGRLEAMEVVVAIVPHHAVPLLQTVLAVGNEVEKVRAIAYLTEPRCAARDPGAALAAIAGALGDGQESVVASAIAGISALASEDDYLTQVGPYLESANLVLARAAVDGLRMFASPRAVAALHLRLRAGPNVLRFAALDALEVIGTGDVLNPLVEALGHAQIRVRTRAGEILSRLGKAHKIDLARTVIWLLRTRDVNVRRMAVELVQTVEDPDGELWPKLLGFLRDEDWWVRERVMDALTDMAGEKLLRHLVGFLQDPSDSIRRFGVDALLRLRSPASLGTLLRTAASDPDWWVRERAIEAVAAIRDPRAAPHLADIMLKNPQLQVACLAALAAIGGGEAASEVASLLQSDDGDVQLAALSCLKSVGGSAQAPAVQPLFRDSRPQVRAMARELIVRWGEASGPERASVEQPASVLDQLLLAVARNRGDDLILAPGRKPLIKRMGDTEPLAVTVLSAEKVRALVAPHLSLGQLESLEAAQEVDFSYRVESEDLRFRVNVFRQLGGIGAVFRIIRTGLPQLEQLGLPPLVTGLANLQNGLVLVGGATGAGKSTTLAALVDHINRASPRHIITLEDPIEVVHNWAASVVNQREVGTHTGSFAAALRSTLRQDPDVILVGELRDLPTITFAVSAAETGHLVFGTIHTVSAAGTVDRLINAFPAGLQDDVRAMLAGSLRAVVCQHLVPRADGKGRCLAVEIMLNSDAIANLIRKGKTFQIPSVIATSREQGMQLMDMELLRLARDGAISVDEAYARALNKKDFEPLVSFQEGRAPAERPR